MMEYLKCTEIDKVIKYYFNLWIKIKIHHWEKRFIAYLPIMGSQVNFIINAGGYRLVLEVDLWEFNLKASHRQRPSIKIITAIQAVKNPRRNDRYYNKKIYFSSFIQIYSLVNKIFKKNDSSFWFFSMG